MIEQDDGLTARERAFLANNPDAERTSYGVDQPQHQAAPDHVERPEDRNLRGVGGWLLAFVILLVIGSLNRLARTSIDIDTIEQENTVYAQSLEWESLKNSIWIVGALDLTISIVAAFLLCRIFAPLSVRFAIFCLWMLGPVKTLIMLRMGEMPGDLTGLALASSIIPAIWTVYLLRSQRVKLTYYRPEL
jgi:hypothetical protein